MLKNFEKIDISIKELEIEAEALFNSLDYASQKIHLVEKSLINLKAHFQFKFLIEEEEPIIKKPSPDIENEYPFHIAGFQTQICWYICWENTNENTKAYRLMLISEERTLVFHDIEAKPIICKSNLIFSKPLIDTSLQIRLRYIKHLIPFINAFKNYLKNYRISIEGIKSLTSGIDN
ncbi:MAG: hypothetical protein WC436_01725 [Candidatus Babeliales bacterium]